MKRQPDPLYIYVWAAPIIDDVFKTPERCYQKDCRGYKHQVGNCILCGYGPAPMMVNDRGGRLPKTEAEKDEVLLFYADQIGITKH